MDVVDLLHNAPHSNARASELCVYCVSDKYRIMDISQKHVDDNREDVVETNDEPGHDSGALHSLPLRQQLAICGVLQPRKHECRDDSPRSSTHSIYQCQQLLPRLCTAPFTTLLPFTC